MFRLKTVKDYHDNRDSLVLNLVKKYPLYSLDKLAEDLPDLSRHVIQNILEKHDLSTVEKRIAFSHVRSPLFSFWERIKGTPAPKDIFGDMRVVSHPVVKSAVFLAVLVLILWPAAGFLFAKPPAITLEKPEVDFDNQGEKLYVSGKVIPAGSRLQVNHQAVSVNGDGTFTAIVSISLGESVLELEASSWWRQARLVRLVNRILTSEEAEAKKDEEASKRKEASDRVATIDRTVNDLLAAKNAASSPQSAQKAMIKVLDSHLKEEAGFTMVEGEILNMSDLDIGWVMVNVTFYDQNEAVVDKKLGFATEFNQILKPGQTAPFVTQATTKEFAHYALELSWQEVAPAVAGAATIAPVASPSGTIP